MPTKRIIINKRDLPEIPRCVAICPICGADLVIDNIDEWESKTGRVTETGFHITCSTQPEFLEETYLSADFSDVDDWFAWHYSMPYIDWLPVETKIYQWFDKQYRLDI